MKRNAFTTGMLGIVLVFGLVLTGCPDTTGNPPIVTVTSGTSSTGSGAQITAGTNGSNGVVRVYLANIAGVTAPQTGNTGVSAITPTAQYTGTVQWIKAADSSPLGGGNFAAGTTYKAVITLTPKNYWTFSGVAANFFTVIGAISATNTASSHIVTAVFQATLLAGSSAGDADTPLGDANEPSVTLAGDTDMSSNVDIDGEKTIDGGHTLDTNGHVLDVKENTTVAGSGTKIKASGANSGLVVDADKTLTVEDGAEVEWDTSGGGTNNSENNGTILVKAGATTSDNTGSGAAWGSGGNAGGQMIYEYGSRAKIAGTTRIGPNTDTPTTGYYLVMYPGSKVILTCDQYIVTGEVHIHTGGFGVSNDMTLVLGDATSPAEITIDGVTFSILGDITGVSGSFIVGADTSSYLVIAGSAPGANKINDNGTWNGATGLGAGSYQWGTPISDQWN
jgi:hypothetical protein